MTNVNETIEKACVCAVFCVNGIANGYQLVPYRAATLCWHHLTLASKEFKKVCCEDCGASLYVCQYCGESVSHHPRGWPCVLEDGTVAEVECQDEEGRWEYDKGYPWVNTPGSATLHALCPRCLMKMRGITPDGVVLDNRADDEYNLRAAGDWPWAE